MRKVMLAAVIAALGSVPAVAQEYKLGTTMGQSGYEDRACRIAQNEAWSQRKVTRVSSCRCSEVREGNAIGFRCYVTRYSQYSGYRSNGYSQPNPYVGSVPGWQSNGDVVTRGVR